MDDIAVNSSGAKLQDGEAEGKASYGESDHRLRLLVAIASYGAGHLHFLKQIIAGYQSLPMDVHIVVLSESTKDLDPGVEVVVGLPSKNPWTLPFAHKRVFAERVDQFDLFIYSEDDIGVSEKHLRAFLQATAQLAPDEIAGFMRYEVGTNGVRFLVEPWGHFHWKPETVKQRGDYTVAEFTNEHAGFYVLTQSQLKRAIASGGFLREPYRQRYSWPETAATDPYTSCGFRKVLCISDIESFLVHHLPNRYFRDLPVSLPAFHEQIQTLKKIRDGMHPASTLCDVEPVAWQYHWQKTYFEQPRDELFALIPRAARSILSIGCGWGATERVLTQRGAHVIALPLDSVMGHDLEVAGMEVIYGSLEDCLEHQLAGRQFDCVLMTNLLHLQPEPALLLRKCMSLVRGNGSIVLSGPNFARFPWVIKRHLGLRPFRRLRHTARRGLRASGARAVSRLLASSSFRVTATRWIDHRVHHPRIPPVALSLGSFTAREWILQATRFGT